MITSLFVWICDQNHWPFQNNENSHFSLLGYMWEEIAMSDQLNIFALPSQIMFSQQLKANEPLLCFALLVLSINHNSTPSPNTDWLDDVFRFPLYFQLHLRALWLTNCELAPQQINKHTLNFIDHLSPRDLLRENYLLWPGSSGSVFSNFSNVFKLKFLSCFANLWPLHTHKEPQKWFSWWWCGFKMIWSDTIKHIWKALKKMERRPFE